MRKYKDNNVNVKYLLYLLFISSFFTMPSGQKYKNKYISLKYFCFWKTVILHPYTKSRHSSVCIVHEGCETQQGDNKREAYI